MRSAPSNPYGLLRWGRVVLVTVPAVACTSILGIDGTYVLEQAASSDGGNSSGGDGGSSPGTGGTDESGGVFNVGGTGGSAPADGGSGGRTGSGGAGANSGAGTGGGTDTGGSAGAGGGSTGGQQSSGGGGVVVDAGPPDPNCKAGDYTGTFEGLHAPAVTVVGVPFVVSGNFSFTLTGTAPTLHVSKTALFKSTLAWGTWTIDLDGVYDCNTRMLVGTLNGVVSAAPVSAKMNGTMTGSLATGGEWREAETIGGNAASCKPGPPTVAPTGTGCGTWRITTRP